MSFMPSNTRHEPHWIKGELGEFCARCGRDREWRNALHPPYPENPFRSAVTKAFHKEDK